MTPNAERINGLAAMLGIIAAMGAYAVTGQVIPGVWWVSSSGNWPSLSSSLQSSWLSYSRMKMMRMDLVEDLCNPSRTLPNGTTRTGNNLDRHRSRCRTPHTIRRRIMYPYKEEIASSIRAFLLSWTLILVPVFALAQITHWVNPPVIEVD